jgi:peroxiredoxin Q/BCP
VLAIGAGVAGLYAVTLVGGGGQQGSGDYVYAVGAPGPGEIAPSFALASTKGGTLDIGSYRGKEQLLLYFQEGLMCPPCWDQIVAIEQEMGKFRALGVDLLVSITGDPLHLLEQKVADEAIASPVLSDPTYAASDLYDARDYGMMYGQTAGHTFILVGKDGTVRWRADYGGEPNYTMFVPTDVLLQHLREGIERSA